MIPTLNYTQSNNYSILLASKQNSCSSCQFSPLYTQNSFNYGHTGSAYLGGSNIHSHYNTPCTSQCNSNCTGNLTVPVFHSTLQNPCSSPCSNPCSSPCSNPCSSPCSNPCSSPCSNPCSSNRSVKPMRIKDTCRKQKHFCVDECGNCHDIEHYYPPLLSYPIHSEHVRRVDYSAGPTAPDIGAYVNIQGNPNSRFPNFGADTAFNPSEPSFISNKISSKATPIKHVVDGMTDSWRHDPSNWAVKAEPISSKPVKKIKPFFYQPPASQNNPQLTYKAKYMKWELHPNNFNTDDEYN